MAQDLAVFICCVFVRETSQGCFSAHVGSLDQPKRERTVFWFSWHLDSAKEGFPRRQPRGAGGQPPRPPCGAACVEREGEPRGGEAARQRALWGWAVPGGFDRLLAGLEERFRMGCVKQSRFYGKPKPGASTDFKAHCWPRLAQDVAVLFSNRAQAYLKQEHWLEALRDSSAGLLLQPRRVGWATV